MNNRFDIISAALLDDGNHAPYYDPPLRDMTGNSVTLEPGYYDYYTLGDFGKGDSTSLDYATLFPSDGIDVYYLDEDNNDSFLLALTVVPLYHIDGNFHLTFSPINVPANGQYFILLTARDEYDTITFSFGVNIENEFPLIPVLIGVGTGVAALAIIILVSISANRKKKARIQQQEIPKIAVPSFLFWRSYFSKSNL